MSTPKEFLQRLRALPPAPAPNDDVSRIKGNLQRLHMDLALRVFAYESLGPVFASKQTSHILCTEIWVKEVGADGVSRPLRVENGNYIRDGVTGKAGHLEGFTICEAVVQPGKLSFRLAKSPTTLLGNEDMLNVHDGLAGACAIHLAEMCGLGDFVHAVKCIHHVLAYSCRCTFSALVTLSFVTGIPPSGVSSAMNVIWHKPAGL